MARIAFDTETWLIQPGLLVPRLVCGSFFGNAVESLLFDRFDTLERIEHWLRSDAHIVIQNAAFDMAVVANERPHLLPLIFKAYDQGRIRCTKIREKLIAIARGELRDDDHPGKKVSFALDAIVLRRFNVDISGDKKDPNAWRLRYHEIDGVPLEQWPAEAVRYAKDDAVWHMKVFENQAEECGVSSDGEGGGCESFYMPNEREQTRRAFALHLMGCWGVRTDPAAVQALSDRIAASVDEARKVLALPAERAHTYMQSALSGLLPDSEQFAKVLSKAFEGTEIDWSVPEGEAGQPIIRLTPRKPRGATEYVVDESENQKVLRALVTHAYGVIGQHPPRTAPSERHPEGQVQFGAEVLEATRDPRLLLRAHISNDEKIKSVWLDHLWKGTQAPITARWDSPLATGRTSCAEPPLQQPMRKGGVRECFVPRPGFWFLATDYSFIELDAWAQVCYDLFGYSDLGEVIKAGKDPHCVMGVEIIRAEGRGEFACGSDTYSSDEMTYDLFLAALKAGAPWAKEYRQLAKAANFGYPGGLQAKTFIAYAWGNYGVRLDLRKAELVRAAWLAAYREAQAYLDYHKGMAPQWGDTFTVTQHRSERVRGGCTYTSGCNTRFQGLAADGAEEAHWRIVKECYLGSEKEGEKAPLYGCRPVLFLHDEFVLEVPADPDRAHAANLRLMEHMVEGMKVFIPDVPVKAEPSLMDRWFKAAEPVYDEKGRLTLWHPDTKSAVAPTPSPWAPPTGPRRPVFPTPLQQGDDPGGWQAEYARHLQEQADIASGAYSYPRG